MKIARILLSSFWGEDQVVPPKRYIIGKSHTLTIERDNSNTRHHLGRMTRKTKVVSKSVEMVDMTLKMWCALIDQDIFKSFQARVLSIFK